VEQKRSFNETLDWLKGNPSLDELMERHPTLWEETGRELVAVLEDGRAQQLSEFSSRKRKGYLLWLERVRKSRRNLKVIEAAVPHLVRSRMALLAMEKCYVAAATGNASGTIRFGFVNGFILQRLLFREHLTRKPVSLRFFGLWWPVLSQKRLLMPLVQPRGIYCFYTRELIREISQLVGDRPCLEIAAGDGTLTAFLREKGVNVRATDSHAWTHTTEYPGSVERLDAEQALEKYRPQSVLCSWPPPGNSFERRVFTTKSVDLYIVIGSRYRFASGNWESYEAQRDFDWQTNAQLSRYVLPPELDSAVLIFQRRRT
jgi:hypothetical protein